MHFSAPIRYVLPSGIDANVATHSVRPRRTAGGDRFRMSRLEGKVALVTGAGRGIGKGIALAYGDEGAFVVCTARTASEVDDVAERIVTRGGRARSVTADVTDPAEVRRLFEQGLAGEARLDILVANAGRGAGPDKAAVAESDPAVWRDLLEVNLLGAYHCAREAIPYLRVSDAAKIIMMGSGSRWRAQPRLSAYSAAKAGLWALTRTLAAELRPHHIAVNEIIPGPVLKEHMLTPEKLREIDDRDGIELPHGEWHKVPADLAELALFLATQPRLGPTGQSFSLLRS